MANQGGKVIMMKYWVVTDKWDLEEYGDLVYTEDEFNVLKEVFKQ